MLMAMSMKGSGSTIRHRVSAVILMLMEHYTKGSGLTTNNTDTALNHGLMERDTMAHTSKARRRAAAG
jgi:succinate dehydrogenase hydrophobic anchor subunit